MEAIATLVTRDGCEKTITVSYPFKAEIIQELPLWPNDLDKSKRYVATSVPAIMRFRTYRLVAVSRDAVTGARHGVYEEVMSPVDSKV